MRLVIVGTGGHARVLLSALKHQGLEVAGCIAPAAPDTNWPNSIPYFGGDCALEALNASSDLLLNGVGSTRSTISRAEVFIRAKVVGLNFLSVIHPRCFVAEEAKLGEGVQVMAGAVIQTGAKILENVIVNTSAVVDHDCLISAHCHISSGVHLSGGVSVGTGTHIGTGAVVIQGIHIGERVIVGAGTVVIRDISSDSLVVGNPAHLLSNSETHRCAKDAS
jgi:UDP-perosamine 4-acetyltransferase